MRSRFIHTAFVAILSLTAFGVSAQNLPGWARSSNGAADRDVPQAPPPPNSGCETFSDCDGPPVPIDGGLGLLALAGGAYAVKRLRRKDEDGDETDA